MLRFNETDEKFEIISIPSSMLMLAGGCLVLQIAFCGFVINALQSLSVSEFFGYMWIERVMNIVIYSLPIMFAGFIYLAMPVTKVEINRHARIVLIKKLTPFRRPRKFGFDYIKKGIQSNLEDGQVIKKGSLYFELQSGEKVAVIEDNSTSLEKKLEIMERANNYF